MLLNPDFGKAKALCFLIYKFSKEIKNLNIENIFNNIAQDKDEYDIRYIDFNYQDFLKLNKSYLKDPIISKIYYLKECTYCSLSREANPKARELIEKSIVNFTQNYSQDKNLVITDLASGYLLQIFIILNKIIKLNYKSITLNLIDNLYKNINLNNNFKFSDQEKAYLVKVLSAANTYPYAKTDESTYKQNNFYLTEKFTNLIDRFIIYHALCQFISWFKNLNINLNLNIFNNTQKFLKLNKKTNILLAIDYLIDLSPELYIEWNNLRKNNLSKNSYAWSLSKKAYSNSEKILLSQGNSEILEHFDWNSNIKNFIKT